ncbi:MAG: Wzz/FepE/Etk N-terminal domain-containing protein [Bacteroidales bacterium]|nr:Wzz/FepE/Etk N-terminal domain-containing protein [Bacteroidales bacterium]
MKNKAYPEFRLDSFSLVNFILRNWKVYFFTGLAAFIISALVSLFITPRYESEVILYPSGNVGSTGAQLFGSGTQESSFGDEEAVERILQVLQSDNIRERLVEKYSLFEHYDISRDTRYRYTQLNRKMDRNINFGKTRFMSVRLTIMDEDPVIAAAMANDIASMIDSTFNRLIKETGRKHLRVLEKQQQEQALLISLYEDSLRMMAEAHGRAGRQYAGSDSRVDNMADYGPAYVRLSESHEQAVEDMGMIRQKITEARIAAGEDFPYIMVVNEAQVAEKKSFPRRGIIVILSTISVLLFVFFVMLITEGISLRRETGKSVKP